MLQANAPVVRLHGNDNVVVAATALKEGASLESGTVHCREPIEPGHKVSSRAIAAGEPVRKYDQIIGFASRDIPPGSHVHTHNCAMGDFERDYAIGTEARATEFVATADRATFQGLVRPDGRVATRNYIGVLTTVNCSATVARMIASAFDGATLADYPNVDGVAAFAHGTGCGMGGDGEGLATLQRTLHGYLRHPNLAGALLVGLGCEGNQINALLEAHGMEPGPTFQHMNIQDMGGTRACVEEGIRRIRAMLPLANEVSRQPVSAEHLTVALQCGGSDGYSGITANPALGAAADLLVRNGGTVILAETPEIYGAEHLLTRRAVSRQVGQKLLTRIRWWEDYTRRNKAEMNNNPSPGNKAGGLTTILEKSLGAVAKGGTTRLTEVYEYAEPVSTRGLVFMDTPGYDPASVTGEVAGGANLVCFTTGRGSVFGYKPAPSIKLATNSALYQRLSEDMDIDCGEILSRDVSLPDMGERIFRLMLDVASGTPSKSEALGFGDNEFTPWVVGAVM